MATYKELSKSRALAARLVYAALRILKDNGKEMPMRELMSRIEKEVELDEWAKERYEKSGYIRWQSILHFYSIGCMKAGYLIKKKGVWYITPEGEEALKLGPEGLHIAADKLYKKWAAERPIVPDEEDEEATTQQELTFDEMEQKALEGLEQYINSKNAYELQDIVAALLRGMGYYTPFIAPKGKDGGLDIVAYRDPLGTESPRIRVQVKHRESSASVQEVRQLLGLLHKEGDVGIFVSTGGFTTDAKSTARSAQIHVELIDLSRFLGLWTEFYDKMTDEDKSLMPLQPIYFLSTKKLGLS